MFRSSMNFQLQMSTKKYSQTESRDLVGMFRTPSLGNSTSVALRKLLQGGRSHCIQVCNKGNRQSERQILGFKLRNSAFFVWEHASLWVHWIQSFICTSAIWGQSCSPSLHSPSSPATTVVEWQHLLDHSFGSSHSHLEARNRWWLWHFLLIWREIFSFHTDFPMTCCLLFPPKSNNNNSFVFLYQGANPEVSDTVTSLGVNQMLAEGTART